jgi:uncharacterized FlaG/YvyC family protein
MAQSITPIQGLAGAASPIAPTAVPTTEQRALNRSVSAAVQTLNDAGYAGDGRQLTYSLDPATGRPVTNVIDTSTKQVLERWPPEYLLQIAADAQKLTRDSG